MNTLKTIELFTWRGWIVWLVYTLHFKGERERKINAYELLDISIHVTFSQVGWQAQYKWTGTKCYLCTSIAVLRRHRAWGGGASCRGEILNPKYRNYILWHLVVTLVIPCTVVCFFTWFSQVCPARWTISASSLSPPLHPFPQLQAQRLKPSLGWLGMEPESGFRASCLSWPVSFNHAYITKDFLFANSFPVFSFVSLPGGSREDRRTH